MQYNNLHMNNTKSQYNRKPGRTLVINSDTPILTDNFSGLINHVVSTNGSQFYLFDTIDNANTVYMLLKEQNHKIKFAHYRIFFTISGLDDSINYNTIKEEHINWIMNNSGANVLYYKQYRKNGKYLGCGDFTIDTKESMDILLDKEKFKTFNFNTFSGSFYRFNNKKDLSNTSNFHNHNNHYNNYNDNSNNKFNRNSNESSDEIN